MTGSNIMVVDDVAGIRELLSEVLSGKGFNVTSARDGRESLKYMRTKNFDLLITDINMPRLNGVELLKRMKAEGRKEKVVVMTGGNFDWSEFRKEIPLIYFQLKKPFKMDELLRVVSYVLKSKRRNAAAQTARKTRKKEGKCYTN
jgi:DNA-binding NtrC family response regulator